MIAIIDYGMGNLRSVAKAFAHVGAEVVVTTDPEMVRRASHVVLPGVGAFGEAMDNLRRGGMIPVIEEVIGRGVPFLGICLGQQLLFEESEEMGRHAGLGILRGRVRRFGGGLKVPHMGWNQLRIVRPSPLLATIADGSFAYFVHSYYVDPADPDVVLATTDYGIPFASIVGRRNVAGIQFHPEKSQAIGLTILRTFASMASVG
jgi:glutamine amidotransferase